MSRTLDELRHITRNKQRLEQLRRAEGGQVMNRTWTQIGRETYGFVGSDRGEKPSVKPAVGKKRIATAIERLEWGPPTGEFPMCVGLGISAAIKDLRLPRVAAVASSSALAPYGLYGIEANYTNGRARVYVVDRGSDLLPVASDFFGEVA